MHTGTVDLHSETHELLVYGGNLYHTIWIVPHKPTKYSGFQASVEFFSLATSDYCKLA